MGNWKVLSVTGDNAVQLIGLSTEVGQLPSNVGTGSTAYCVDTGDLYMYESSTDQWYQQ